MSSLTYLAQQSNQFTFQSYHDSLFNLVFFGVFIVAAIVFGVWWIKRYM
jgi:hypothetical protein